MRTDAAESSEKSSVKEVPGASAEGTSAYLWLRTIFRWILAAGFFFSVCPWLILLGIFVDPLKNDEPQRWLSRTLMRLAGVRVEVRRSPGFDPRTFAFLSPTTSICLILSCFTAPRRKLSAGWSSSRIFASLYTAG